MSITTTTPTPVRPKRRRLQFSLRTMMALTLLVCVGLWYKQRQHQAEQRIVELALKLDPAASAVWGPPDWWRSVVGHKPAGIFEQVRHLTLHGDQFGVTDVIHLPLERLPGLRQLTLLDTEIWDEDYHQLLVHFAGQFPIRHLDTCPPTVSPAATAYLQDPNPETRSRLRRAMLQMARRGVNFRASPQELGANQYVDKDEEVLLQLLVMDDEELCVLAARTLWRLHSIRHARPVIQFIDRLQPADEHARRLKAEIVADIRTEAILKELNKGNIWWGSWLAAHRPDPSLTQAMISILIEGRATDETVYALSKSNDPQVVTALVPLLSGTNRKICQQSVKVLVSLDDESVEMQLIDGLRVDDATFLRNAIIVLSVIGTKRCMPELERIARDPNLTVSYPSIPEAIDKAIELIDLRGRYPRKRE